MSKKKTVCLQEIIAKVAEQKARMVSGGNFSSYISMLIYKDNEEEVKREIEEEEKRKPERTSEVTFAKYKNECVYCKKSIRIGDEICKARFADGFEQYVHRKCCRG